MLKHPAVAWFRHAVKRFGLPRAAVLALNTWLLMRRFKWPIYGRREKRALLAVLRSRNWGGAPSPNHRTARFAERFAEAHSARYGICTTSGSVALGVAYRALGLRPGDEILVPALTFSSTASAALELGVLPRFVDVDPRTMCIDSEGVEEAITEQTKAVVAVHLGAQLCDLDALSSICRRHGLRLIEDCAHAHGGKWRDRGAGSWGDVGCFSFQTTKTMSAGEGGILLTNDQDVAARCAAIVDCGRASREQDLPHGILGSNYRMTEFQAALLEAQLDRLGAHTGIRERHANLLDRLLADVDGISVLEPYEGLTVRSVYGYYFRYLGERAYRISRAQFLQELFTRGVPAVEEMYRPVYRSPEFGWRDTGGLVEPPFGPCPVAERAASRELVWIPHMAFLTSSRQIRRLAEAVISSMRVIRSRAST